MTANADRAALLIAALPAGHLLMAPIGRPASPQPSPDLPAELNTAAPTVNGARLIAARCAMCHKAAELARREILPGDVARSRLHRDASAAELGRVADARRH